MTNYELWLELCACLGRDAALPGESADLSWTLLSEHSRGLQAGDRIMSLDRALCRDWLTVAFDWQGTPEGVNYWSELADALSEGVDAAASWSDTWGDAEIAVLRTVVREFRCSQL